MPRDDIAIDVIEALAEADGVEPAELDYNLSDYLDPGVLEKLGEIEDGIWELTFRVSDHQVTVTHEGQVLIDGMRYSADTARYE